MGTSNAELDAAGDFMRPRGSGTPAADIQHILRRLVHVERRLTEVDSANGRCPIDDAGCSMTFSKDPDRPTVDKMLYPDVGDDQLSSIEVILKSRRSHYKREDLYQLALRHIVAGADPIAIAKAALGKE